MHTLSPEANKAVEDARIRDTHWRPTLSRTTTKLILTHAVNNRNGQRQEMARRMQDLGWSWDSQKCWFYAELSPQNLKAVLDAWTDGGARLLKINLSDGVRQYQKQLRDQALPVSHSRGRSKLFKS